MKMTVKQAMKKKLVTPENISRAVFTHKKQDYNFRWDNNNSWMLNIQLPYKNGQVGMATSNWENLPEFFGKKKVEIEIY